ncbi:MAG: T9SS type A sorting domain-containing protein [Candidatus Kapabacteria bacterium]|nr:T9SS type A sorting domain-containing protein [Candidatus Kapabacteria bacterium]
MRKILLPVLLVIMYSNFCNAVDSCKIEIGMNLRGINLWWREYEQAFVDVMKSSLYWYTQNVNNTTPVNTNQISQIPLDGDGYPLSLPVTVSGQSQPQVVSTQMLFNINGDYPKGVYTMLYDGDGTFAFSGDASIASSAPGRILLNIPNTTNAGIILKILSSSTLNHVRNIRIIMPDKEVTYQSQPFNDAFLEKISPFKTLRFVWWTFTNGNENVQWQNRRKTSYYNQANYADARPCIGVAYEYVIALCNQVKKNPWINVPTQADTNYIRMMAEMFRDNLDPNLKIYLEYSNEVWNPIMWTEYNWVNTNGPQNLPNLPQRYAYFAKRTFDIWIKAFGGQASSRIIRVAAAQKGNPWIGQQVMTYLSANGGADALAIDGYIDLRPIYYDSLNTLGANIKVTDVIRIARKDFEDMKMLWRQNKATAQTYKLPLIIYEGGQSLVPQNGQDHPYNNAMFDAQIDTAMYNIYNELITYLRDSTEAKLFMHFNLVSDRKNNQLGSFGSLESVYLQMPYKLKAPKYQALLDNICSTVNPQKYTLTINSGSGSGLYNEGEKVNIIANPAPIHYTFDHWSGDTGFLNDSMSTNPTLIMPNKNLSITAIFKKKDFSLVVRIMSSGLHIQGAYVIANTLSNYTDQQGSCTFYPLVTQAVKISVSKSGYSSIDNQITIISDTLLNFELSQIIKIEYLITVEVMYNGAPVSNAIVRLDTLNKISDQSGIAIFNKVPQGMRQLFVSEKNYQDYSQEININSDSIISVSLLRTKSVESSVKVGFIISNYPESNYIVLTNNYLKIIELRIYNEYGELVFIKKTEETSMIDISSLPSGMYFCTLQAGTEKITAKFVVVR